MRTSTRLCLLALVTLGPACSVQDTKLPPLAGPSELGLRIALQVSPDSILQDGLSQAAVQIDASSYNGQPARGLTVRVETLVDGILQDFGTLSAKTAVTGDDGRARIVYTAPPRPAQPVDDFNVVMFRVYPVGTDFTGEVPRTATLRLVTPGVLIPPNPGVPEPDFTFAPSAPAVFTPVVFDASGSKDDGVVCGAACSYAWDFGDGDKAAGIFTNHEYSKPGTYQVRLTVTDGRGASASVAKAVTVGGGTAPTAVFTYSPISPAISQLIHFTAEGSRPATGRQIVSYDWNFGSGRFGTGMTISKQYDTPGTYTVTLTVTDDIGMQATTQQNVTVGATGTGPQPVLTFSPSGGTTSTIFFFDASGTRGPSPIVEYRFTWGDTSQDTVGPSATATHQFALPGTYTVSVTVKDSANRTAIARVTVSVSAPTP